ncbi:MAG: DEAD/DEAH box helicase [Bacteroidales bacterium]|jgi:ATP-dependent RNA helicase RhlE|nr:DEAD/DEAH box helicase [Bacteroidales bacterium]
MKFSQYRFVPELESNLEAAGFKKPTDIQYKAITPILKKEDVLAIAQTGTGKTAAFAIPVIQLLATNTKKLQPGEVRCLVMVPTHELAIQVADVFRQFVQGLDIQVLGLFGGTEQDPQIEQLKKGAEIVVATPGRLFDLESQQVIHLEQVEILVLDEADRMLEFGFLKDMRHLVKKLPRYRQTLFFSATINENIKDLAYGLVRHAVRIQISPKDKVSKNIDHFVSYIEMDHKRFFLESFILKNPEAKILVFVRTKVRAERVFKAMERIEIQTETIHGDKEQEVRTAVMDRFKNGTNKVLIATDVSARGVDIPNVDFVINYDLPDVPENYVHRVGRTGRGVNRGTAITFCSEEEKEILKEIETFLKKPISILDIEKKDYKLTVDLTMDTTQDWRALMKEQEKIEETLKRKPHKKKK